MLTNTTKAAIDFSRLTAAELLPAARLVLQQMTANAAVFPSPPVSMAALGTLVGTYSDCLTARASRTPADVRALGEARAALIAALRLLGAYVNTVAQGNEEIVRQGGFPGYSTVRPRDTSPPAAPENVRLLHGPRSGEIIARYRTQRKPGTHEVQITTGNPNLEEGWRTVAVASGQKALLGGLTPGTHTWVRIRTAGLRGVMGDWSDPAEIMVI